MCRWYGTGVPLKRKVKHNTLRWFGHMERMNDARLVKEEYKGVKLRGRLYVTWTDRKGEF